MSFIKMSHKDGLEFHNTQLHRLGVRGMDENQKIWSYVEIVEDVSAGELVEDQANDDLLSATTGTVTTGTAIGGDTLIDSAEFTGDDFVGAIGLTLGDTIANGAGQGFYVVEMIDANTIKVVVMHGDADPRLPSQAGWETATTATTTYSLWFPGRCKQGDAVPTIPRGVPQVDVDVSVAQFGWVLQCGPGWVKLDESDAQVPVAGEGVVPKAAGLIAGLTAAGTTADDVDQKIGRHIFGDPTDTIGDLLIMVNLNIQNHAVSYRFPRTTHPLN